MYIYFFLVKKKESRIIEISVKFARLVGWMFGGRVCGGCGGYVWRGAMGGSLSAGVGAVPIMLIISVDRRATLPGPPLQSGGTLPPQFQHIHTPTLMVVYPIFQTYIKTARGGRTVRRSEGERSSPPRAPPGSPPPPRAHITW